MTPVPLMPKASANVSSMAMPLTFMTTLLALRRLHDDLAAAAVDDLVVARGAKFSMRTVW